MKILKLLILIALAGPAFAATPKDAPPTPVDDQIEITIANPLVKRVQQALIDAGYYAGAADGRMSESTIAAIRKYQRRENLAPDGIASEQLAGHIETSSKVQSLLKQLRLQRKVNIDAARQALLSNPETKDLLSHEDDRIADPSRDVAPCFAAPDPECLLTEASESAKAIGKRELRDWAFGEILVVQAKAGMVEEALASIRHIEDPRLIILALHDIAKALASAGRPAEALSAVTIIPSAQKQADALAAIADIQLRRGDGDGARASAAKLLDSIDGLEDKARRMTLGTRAAVILHKAGDEKAAAAELARLEAMADASPAAYRHIAGALAEMAKTEQALAMLKHVPDPSEHTSVLVTAATTQARGGDAELAIATADRIEAVRYRAVALSRIAVAQSLNGDSDSSQDTINMALAASEEIKLPFARAYAYDQIALGLSEIGKMGNEQAFQLAMVSAAQITDDKLRAHRLWSIAAARHATGNWAEAETAETAARKATEMIKSKLTRTWMFTEICLERLAEKKTETARVALDKAVHIAEAITNAWSRARALARLASTLIEVSAAD